MAKGSKFVFLLTTKYNHKLIIQESVFKLRKTYIIVGAKHSNISTFNKLLIVASSIKSSFALISPHLLKLIIMQLSSNQQWNYQSHMP